MRDFFQRIMYGRYGMDNLGRANLWVYIIVLAVYWLTHLMPLYWLALALLLLFFFRMFSRNTWKRQQENAKFLSMTGTFTGGIRFRSRKIREWRHYRYRKCPHCSAVLRLPRKRGKHQVCCPKCRQDFDVRIRF